ncbi:hypothetical protein B0H19DRAFT_1084445 [Mycena capillaripes]|nr:hypothetical protein B0H19DRAFT_1084445 [Mycena capillaripes]
MYSVFPSYYLRAEHVATHGTFLPAKNCPENVPGRSLREEHESYTYNWGQTRPKLPARSTAVPVPIRMDLQGIRVLLRVATMNRRAENVNVFDGGAQRLRSRMNLTAEIFKLADTVRSSTHNYHKHPVLDETKKILTKDRPLVLVESKPGLLD